MSWQSEFGEEYAVPEEISKALYDASWHNDSAPSFWRKDDPASATPHTETSLTAEFPTYIMWVEHPDPAQREMGGKRFGVAKYIDRGDAYDIETIIETDDAAEALKSIMAQPMSTQESAGKKSFKVLFSHKDPSGKGIASGTVVIRTRH